MPKYSCYRCGNPCETKYFGVVCLGCNEECINCYCGK